MPLPLLLLGCDAIPRGQSDPTATIARVLSCVGRLHSTPTTPSHPTEQFNSDKMGIYQIFLFDPDGNVIEISNCAPPVGEVACMPRVKGAGGRKGEPHARL